jgi:hypothetical protein
MVVDANWGTQAADDAISSGQWTQLVVCGLPGQRSHDRTKPGGFGQQLPLTPEYVKVFEE